MTKEEIESQIAKIKANKFLPEALRAKALQQQEDKLKALDVNATEAPKVKAVSHKKKTEKKHATPKSKVVPKSITVEGKTITEGEADFCDKVVSAWYERRAKAKQSARKTKTTPVFNKIAGEVADSVMKAVKSVSASEIKKDPKDFKIEADKLSEKAREFLGAFKSLLGSDFHESEVEKEFKELEHVIEALITKHKQKMEDGGIVKETPKKITKTEIETFINEGNFKFINGRDSSTLNSSYNYARIGNRVIIYPHSQAGNSFTIGFIIHKLEGVGKVESIEESATEAANEPVTASEEIHEEKEIERALSLAHKAAKHEVHATDTTFEGFKNRVKDDIEGDYSEIEQKIAYDCLHVSGFKHGGKISNRLKHKYAKVARVMREFYAGKLKTHKRVVKNRKQAQAIAMSEAGLSRN